MTGEYTDAVTNVTIRDYPADPDRLLFCRWGDPCVSKPVIEISNMIIRRQLVPLDRTVAEAAAHALDAR